MYIAGLRLIKEAGHEDDPYIDSTSNKLVFDINENPVNIKDLIIKLRKAIHEYSQQK